MKPQLNFICVRVGDAYPWEYVSKLLSMIDRHCEQPFHFRCLTDAPIELEGVEMVDISSYGLHKWWPKMLLFNPLARGDFDRTIYFDLDTVILGPLDKLIAVDAPFAICGNFTRAAGNVHYPCKYGSCVMTFDRTFGSGVFDQFIRRPSLMDSAGSYGDQWVVEHLYPNAPLLQSLLPLRYFVGYRSFTPTKPAESVVAVFAGKYKPHNSHYQWIKEAWN